MATENKFINDQLRGVGSRIASNQVLTLTVAGNTTVSGTLLIPDGSWIDAVTLETPTAISGTPTTCNVSIGTAAAGAQIVAAVDAKAQGHIATTIVAGLDKIAGFVGLNTVYAQVVTAGGTSSAGNIYVRVSYSAPVT